MSKLLHPVVLEDIQAVLARPWAWEQLAGTRVVVSGAGGFLGGYLVRTLLALHEAGRISRPVHVVALVRDTARAARQLGELQGHPQLQLMTWDLNQIAVPDLGPVHYVLHAASQASPRFYNSDPVGTLLPNTLGTAALLEAQRRGGEGRGFLFVSSSEVYGAVRQETPLIEDAYGVVDPASVRACYAESKRMGETLCVAWHHHYRLKTLIVRPFHTYGPGLASDDGRVFADFAYNIARGEDIVMNSDGQARRAFCYVSDAVAGFFAVLLHGEAGTPYNVANPEGELAVAELAELLVGLFPEKGLRVERRLPPNSDYLPSTYSRLVPDVQRLQRLGWTATVAPVAGFERMIRTLQP